MTRLPRTPPNRAKPQASGPPPPKTPGWSGVMLTRNELSILYELIDKQCQEIQLAGLQETASHRIRDKITEAMGVSNDY